MLLNEDHLKVLQEVILDKIKEAAKDDRLLNAPFLPSILYYWKKWGRQGEVKNWVNRVISSDEKLPIFLVKFLQNTWSVTITNKVAKVHWELNLNELKEFIDLDILERRCNEVTSNNLLFKTLDDKQKLAIKLFLKAKRSSDEEA